MFSQKHRLAKSAEVRKVLSRGRAFFNPWLTVRFFRTFGPPRFTMVVSTKVSKLASCRNRIKRVLRQAVISRLASFVPGDYAVIVKPAATQASEPELVAKFFQLCEKNSLLKI